jgi:hypothetical protein
MSSDYRTITTCSGCTRVCEMVMATRKDAAKVVGTHTSYLDEQHARECGGTAPGTNSAHPFVCPIADDDDVIFQRVREHRNRLK